MVFIRTDLTGPTIRKNGPNRLRFKYHLFIEVWKSFLLIILLFKITSFFILPLSIFSLWEGGDRTDRSPNHISRKWTLFFPPSSTSSQVTYISTPTFASKLPHHYPNWKVHYLKPLKEMIIKLRILQGMINFGQKLVLRRQSQRLGWMISWIWFRHQEKNGFTDLVSGVLSMRTETGLDSIDVISRGKHCIQKAVVLLFEITKL